MAHGAIIVKFWLAISPDELRRFRGAKSVSSASRLPKIGVTDDKWDDYVQAVGDMVDPHQHHDPLGPWLNQRQISLPGKGSGNPVRGDQSEYEINLRIGLDGCWRFVDNSLPRCNTKRSNDL